jgi:hypothetical protein
MTSNEPIQLQRQITILRHENLALSVRISKLEKSCADMRAQLKIPPLVDNKTWMYVKQASHALGVSIAGVHYFIRKGKLKLRDEGHPVLVSRKSVRVMQNTKLLKQSART